MYLYMRLHLTLVLFGEDTKMLDIHIILSSSFMTYLFLVYHFENLPFVLMPPLVTYLHPSRNGGEIST